ncbi:MAG: hypothetical protein ACREBU_21550, partial [Nitrososphaera sp.]
MEYIDFQARRQRFVDGLTIRVVVCISFIAVFAATAAIYPAQANDFIAPITVLAVLPFVNYPFWKLGEARGFPLEHFYGHWVVDLFMVTLLLHTLGGIDLPLGSGGYMIMIITSAVLLSQRAALLVATGSLLCFDGLVISEEFGILPHRVHIWSHHYSAAAKVIIVIASNVFFYLFAHLAGSLAEQLKKTNA